MRLSALLAALALSSPAAAAAVNDAQIAAIVVTANQVDIDAGKLADRAANNAEVKKFADLMVTDHTGVNKSATELVTRCTSRRRTTPRARPEGRRRQERRSPEGARRRRVRQSVRRSRGRLSPAGARRRRQDADPERGECRAEGAAGQGASGVRRAPGARSHLQSSLASTK